MNTSSQSRPMSHAHGPWRHKHGEQDEGSAISASSLCVEICPSVVFCLFKQLMGQGALRHRQHSVVAFADTNYVNGMRSELEQTSTVSSVLPFAP